MKIEKLNFYHRVTFHNYYVELREARPDVPVVLTSVFKYFSAAKINLIEHLYFCQFDEACDLNVPNNLQWRPILCQS